MSRFSFVLASALLVVAGSLTFMMTFDRGPKTSRTAEHPDSWNRSHPRATSSRRASEQRKVRSSRTSDFSLSLPDSATNHLNQDQKKQVERILARTLGDSRNKLNQYTDRYQLTKDQRHDIFPLIVAHHEQSHPDMVINGQSLPSIVPGSSLEESLSSFLDPSQQDALIEDTVDHEAWWEDVVGQLESDLDTAINNGEMVPAEDPPVGLPSSNEAAAGDGEASEHSGNNLFDLLGR